jgi:xanthine dehydrogenase accessory factor
MAVTAEKMIGSIGGGMMEYKFVELARQALMESSDDYLLRKQVHSKSAKVNQSGMICSGEQTIYLSIIKRDDIDAIVAMVHSLQSNKHGTLTIDPSGIQFSLLPHKEDYKFEMTDENNWSFREKTGYKNILHIVGGGHCGLALSELMSKMDFQIHIYDDRENLNTMVDNDFVHSKNFIKDYAKLESLIEEGENVYIAIMTFGYRTDNKALRAVIGKNVKYLGVLGSQTKMKELFEEWKRDGLDDEKLKSIHSPIGLQIKSQNPQEIAVSIAAEIIKVKNANL